MLKKGETNSGSFKKGCIPWCAGKKNPKVAGANNWKWKGGDITKPCAVCNKLFTHGRARKRAKYCSRPCANLGFRGTPAWNKGTAKISTENELVRKSARYKYWREAVFERDNYTCQDCQQWGGRLHADHIKPFAWFPELRFDLSNGRTLCIECHKKTPTYGRGSFKFKQHEKT